ncbi:hypothetical protein D3C72_950440 [compost metagenome]
MARTPVSSTVSIGARDKGLMGCADKGASSAPVSGPRPSSGRPAPSSTRPSSALPTGRWRPSCGLALPFNSALRGSGIARCTGGSPGTTRAPGGRPEMSACGIRYSVWPSKPTTSASAQWSWPRAISMRAAAPTGRRRPVACSTRPVARVILPLTSQGSVEAARIEPISSCVFQRSSTGTVAAGVAGAAVRPGCAGAGLPLTPDPPRIRCGPARPRHGASAFAAWRRCRQKAFRRGNRHARWIHRPSRANGLP